MFHMILGLSTFLGVIPRYCVIFGVMKLWVAPVSTNALTIIPSVCIKKTFNLREFILGTNALLESIARIQVGESELIENPLLDVWVLWPRILDLQTLASLRILPFFGCRCGGLLVHYWKLERSSVGQARELELEQRVQLSLSWLQFEVSCQDKGN